MSDTPTPLADGTVPINAPCLNAYVVDVIIVDPSTAPPVLTSIAPDTAEVGGAALTLTATGTGFTPNAVIVFNGGDEPTTWVSPTTVTTQVRPATASGPATVPVLVRDGARRSAPHDFTFSEPAAPPPPEEPESYDRRAYTIDEVKAT